jgi:hypothetical protein
MRWAGAPNKDPGPYHWYRREEESVSEETYLKELQRLARVLLDVARAEALDEEERPASLAGSLECRSTLCRTLKRMGFIRKKGNGC